MADAATDLGFLSIFAGGDSEEEEESEAPRQLTARELRMQRAIDEGKRTYGRGQAETPAMWFADEELVKAKQPEEKQLQRYREYHAAALYERKSFAECLKICDELNATPGYDNRETVDTALRCCLQLKDAAAGERVARGCRATWVTTPYLAQSSAEVFVMLGLHSEAVKALTCALTARKVQYSPLVLLGKALSSWSVSAAASDPARQAVSLLAADVAHIISLSHGVAAAFQRPLFSAKKTGRDKLDVSSGAPRRIQEHALVDAKQLDECCKTLELDARTTGRMHALYRTFEALVRKGGVTEDVDEDDGGGGVRNL